MIFNWQEYLALARFLEGTESVLFSQEAVFRSAVSRAYYAAYCYARNHARDHLGFQPAMKARDHTLLREFLKQRNHVATAQDLDELREWRNACDYDDNAGDLLPTLHSALQCAQAIIDRLSSHSIPSAQSQ